MAIFDMPLESFVYANTSRQTQYYKHAKHRKTALYYIYHMFKRLIHTKKKDFRFLRAPAGSGRGCYTALIQREQIGGECFCLRSILFVIQQFAADYHRIALLDIRPSGIFLILKIENSVTE